MFYSLKVASINCFKIRPNFVPQFVACCLILEVYKLRWCCRCYNCGEFANHIAAKCSLGPQPKRCHHCKSEVHLIADCPARQKKGGSDLGDSQASGSGSGDDGSSEPNSAADAVEDPASSKNGSGTAEWAKCTRTRESLQGPVRFQCSKQPLFAAAIVTRFSVKKDQVRKTVAAAAPRN